MGSCVKTFYISSASKMEKFSLKWNDFQTNVSSSFSKLRSEKDFFDVTLVSDDEVHISSHKLVLYASSDFFKNILRKSDHANPLIFLSGVKSKELNFVMDYIYNGEVQLFQSDLDSFLDIAQKLQIDGLISNNETLEKQGNSNQYLNDSFEPKEEDWNEDVIEEVPSSKVKQKAERKPRKQASESFALSTLNIDAKEAIDQPVIRNEDHFECKSCGKTSKTSSDIRSHVEIHIEGLSFECQTCGNTFRNRRLLSWHVYKIHNSRK